MPGIVPDPGSIQMPAPAAGGIVPDAGSIQAPAPAAAPAPQVSGLESFGRGALQSVSHGLSDEITGALESLFTDKSYTQARDESRANNAEAARQNPISYGAGTIAGGLATAVVPGLGAVEGATALGTAARAGVQGAVAGFGSSNADLTKGDVGGALRDTVEGGVTGALVGGALHKAGDVIGGNAEKTFEKDANASLYGKARPKDATQAFRVQDANPEIAKEVIYSDDFKPVLKLARQGKTEEAVDAAQAFVDKASEKRLDNYKIATAEGAEGTIGSVVDRLKKIAGDRGGDVGGEGEGNAVSAMAKSIESRYSSRKLSDIAPQFLESLGDDAPKSETVTSGDLWAAAKKHFATTMDGKLSESAGNVPTPIADAIGAMKFEFDPEAKIPLLKLRQITTAAQKSAVESLGTIAETERARITGSVEQAVNEALETHLDAAAKTSKEAADAVERIRHDDKVISMGLSAKTGLTQKLIKESTGKGATLADRASQTVKGAAQIAGIGLLGHGSTAAGLALEAAPLALKAVGAGARDINERIARLLNAERMGNTYAKGVLDTVRKTPQGQARVSGVLNAIREIPQGAARVAGLAAGGGPTDQGNQ